MQAQNILLQAYSVILVSIINYLYLSKFLFVFSF